MNEREKKSRDKKITEVASEFRFGSEKTAEWESYIKINTKKFDMLEYSKQYISYINDNKDSLLKKFLDSYPVGTFDEKEYMKYFKAELGQILDNIGKRIPITNPLTDEMLAEEWDFFHDILIEAMDVNGIEGI